MKKLFSCSLLLLFCCLSFIATAQNGWTEKSNKKGIQISTKKSKSSSFKQVRIITTINTNLGEMLSVLDDIENYPKWMFKCNKGKKLKIKGKDYAWTDADFPFPTSDRDIVTYTTITQDPNTKVVTYIAKGTPSVYPEQSGYVRIKYVKSQWILKPIGANKVQATYYLDSDPGGNIPTWMVNAFIDKGPYQSLVKLKKLLENGNYLKPNFKHYNK